MSSNDDKISDLFDDWASTSRAHEMSAGHAHMVSFLLHRLGPGGGRSLVDIGCGPGYAMSAATSAGWSNIAGLDVSPKMVSLARAKNPDGDVRVGSAGDLPWPDGSFDAAISVESLYYHESPEISLGDCRRVLRNGGALAIAIDYYLENRATHRWAEVLDLSLHLRSSDDWIEAVRHTGFVSCTATRIYAAPVEQNHFTPSPYFPTYIDYRQYVDEGTLALIARV